MTTVLNGETYITCPFEPSHRIISWRMSKHIQKCKINHPDVKVATCRFNSTHIISETEIAAHEDSCKDRIKLDTFVFRPENVDENKYPINNESIIQDGEETWDDDNCETYNPQEYCLNNKIFRRLDVASAATRKNFRLEERRRFQQLEVKPELSQKNAQDLARRLPKKQSLCMAHLASDIKSEQIIPQLENLSLGNGGDRKIPNTGETEDEKNKEDDFVLVKSIHRGRGRGRRTVDNN